MFGTITKMFIVLFTSLDNASYCFIISGISKSEAINLYCIDLNEKSGH